LGREVAMVGQEMGYGRIARGRCSARAGFSLVQTIRPPTDASVELAASPPTETTKAGR
jgi:hypothetical protein